MNVVLLRKFKNGSTERTITPFNTNELALINFYGNMRASIGDSNCVKVTCELVDDNGHISKCDRYERPVEIEKPEPEESEVSV